MLSHLTTKSHVQRKKVPIARVYRVSALKVHFEESISQPSTQATSFKLTLTFGVADDFISAGQPAYGCDHQSRVWNWQHWPSGPRSVGRQSTIIASTLSVNFSSWFMMNHCGIITSRFFFEAEHYFCSRFRKIPYNLRKRAGVARVDGWRRLKWNSEASAAASSGHFPIKGLWFLPSSRLKDFHEL